MRTYRNCIYVAITLASTAGVLWQQMAAQTVTVPLADRKSQPVVSDVTVSKTAVTDVHLRPLFTTTIRLPDAVSSVAVGAPTLFEAEHADQEPRLVYIKPATKQPAESNLVITMRSGETISMRLISDGNSALNEPVDYIVDYKPQESFFIASSDPIAQRPQEQSAEDKHDPLDLALEGQARVATPAWQSSSALDEKTSKAGAPSIVGALGEIREINGRMLVAYSVRNQSNHWIEILPPQIEVSSPGDKSEIKKKDRKHIVEAEQVPVNSFKVNGRRLAPGERVDGVVTFDRPGFKQSQERLLLELASANSVDQPLLLPVPFVAPGN
jgi:hypothetical protein